MSLCGLGQGPPPLCCATPTPRGGLTLAHGLLREVSILFWLAGVYGLAHGPPNLPPLSIKCMPWWLLLFVFYTGWCFLYHILLSGCGLVAAAEWRFLCIQDLSVLCAGKLSCGWWWGGVGVDPVFLCVDQTLNYCCCYHSERPIHEACLANYVACHWP